jgi:hypothetical protein
MSWQQVSAEVQQFSPRLDSREGERAGGRRGLNTEGSMDDDGEDEDGVWYFVLCLYEFKFSSLSRTFLTQLLLDRLGRLRRVPGALEKVPTLKSTYTAQSCIV